MDADNRKCAKCGDYSFQPPRYKREGGRERLDLLPYGVAYQHAIRLHVDAERRTKQSKKTAPKAKRGRL